MISEGNFIGAGSWHIAMQCCGVFSKLAFLISSCETSVTLEDTDESNECFSKNVFVTKSRSILKPELSTSETILSPSATNRFSSILFFLSESDLISFIVFLPIISYKQHCVIK